MLGKRTIIELISILYTEVLELIRARNLDGLRLRRYADLLVCRYTEDIVAI